MDGTGSGDEGERVMRAWRTIGPLMDLVTPMALRVAATLRLADLIADGAGQGGELARRSGTDPDALGRMMRHLVCHGVFTEPEPGRFGLNGTAELLRSEHPAELRLSLDLDGFGGTMDLAFTGLLHTVRTGSPPGRRSSAPRSGPTWRPIRGWAPPSTPPCPPAPRW